MYDFKLNGFVIYEFSSLVEDNYNNKNSSINIMITSTCSTLLCHIIVWSEIF